MAGAAASASNRPRLNRTRVENHSVRLESRPEQEYWCCGKMLCRVPAQRPKEGRQCRVVCRWLARENACRGARKAVLAREAAARARRSTARTLRKKAWCRDYNAARACTARHRMANNALLHGNRECAEAYHGYRAAMWRHIGGTSHPPPSPRSSMKRMSQPPICFQSYHSFAAYPHVTTGITPCQPRLPPCRWQRSMSRPAARVLRGSGGTRVLPALQFCAARRTRQAAMPAPHSMTQPHIHTPHEPG